jgi:hypothetical protein
LSQKNTTLVISPIGVPVAILGSYMILRYVISLPGGYSTGRADFWMAFSYLVLFFVTMNIMRRRWQLQSVVWALLIVASAVAFFGIVSSADAKRFPLWMGKIQPKHLAAMMELEIPVIAAVVCLTRSPGGLKVLFVSAIILMLEAVVFSFSRAGLLAVGFGLLVILVILVRQGVVKPRWVPLALVAMVVFGGLGIAFSPVMRGRLGELVRHGDPARWDLWDNAFQMGAQNLAIGVGPGMFRQLYPAVRSGEGGGMPATAMSDWLQLFAEFGLVGIVVVVWLVATLAIASIKLVKRWKLQNWLWYKGESEGRGTRHALMVGMMAAVASVALHSFLDSTLQSPGPAVFLVTITAVALAGSRRWGRQRQKDATYEETEDDIALVRTVDLKSPYNRFVGGAATACCLLFAVWIGTALLASVFTTLGDRAQALGRPLGEYRSAYQRAWALDGGDPTAALRLGDSHLQSALVLADNPSSKEAEAEAKTARNWYHLAIERWPRLAHVWVGVAKTNDVLKDFYEANLAYKRALELEPRNASFHVAFAEHYLLWKDRERAIEHLRKAASLEGHKGTGSAMLDELLRDDFEDSGAPQAQ